MTGLAIAFLIVLLASIVSRSGQDENTAAATNEESTAPKEPLAELGVAPGAERDTDQTNNSETQ